MSSPLRGLRLRRWQVIAACLCALVAAGSLLTWGVLGAWDAYSVNHGNSVAAATVTPVPITSIHCSGGSSPYSSCSDTSGDVMLSWSAVSGSPGIYVYRATAATGPWTEIASLVGTATTYTDTTAAYNTQYYYEVASGGSGWPPNADEDMALSLDPTAGTDDTGTATAFSSTSIAAFAVAGDGKTYTDTTAWGATATLLGTQDPDWMGCANTAQCWAYTYQGYIWGSTNGGETWTEETTPSNPIWFGGWFVNASDGWATGNGGTIVATEASQQGNQSLLASPHHA